MCNIHLTSSRLILLNGLSVANSGVCISQYLIEKLGVPLEQVA